MTMSTGSSFWRNHACFVKVDIILFCRCHGTLTNDRIYFIDFADLLASNFPTAHFSTIERMFQKVRLNVAFIKSDAFALAASRLSVRGKLGLKFGICGSKKLMY